MATMRFKLCTIFYRLDLGLVQSWPKTRNVRKSCNFQKTVQENPMGKNSHNLGSILWSQFFAILSIFAKKLAFFSKTNVMIQFLHNIFSKNANFFENFFSENILKTWHRSLVTLPETVPTKNAWLSEVSRDCRNESSLPKWVESGEMSRVSGLCRIPPKTREKRDQRVRSWNETSTVRAILNFTPGH
jgi:hypothetical protein